MRKLIIDCRIRDVEYKYLTNFFNVIKMPLSDDVYEEISGHSDIFYTKINGKIIEAPNAPLHIKEALIGASKVGKKYPDDIPYNVCQIGKNIIGNKYTDSKINPNIKVRQGYTKCSISITSDNSCITTDEKISKILNENEIDTLYITEDNIKLLKKDGSISKMHGFIGGATLLFDNKFVVFGDIEKLTSKNKIINHINKYNLQLVNFQSLDVYDYGSGLIID